MSDRRGRALSGDADALKSSLETPLGMWVRPAAALTRPGPGPTVEEVRKEPPMARHTPQWLLVCVVLLAQVVAGRQCSGCDMPCCNGDSAQIGRAHV